MRRVLAAAVFALFVVVAAPGPDASAQTAPPVTTESTDDGGGKPWGRLAIFVPLSIAIGAGAVYGRRTARDRGWIGS